MRRLRKIKIPMTQNQVIANAILQQLGGGKFVAATGARQLVAIENGLRFRIGRNGSKANMVRIVLKGDDTYLMQFIKIGNAANPYMILLRYANKGLSEAEYNAKVLAATEKAKKAAEPKVLQEYDGIYCDQLEELFRDYTKMNTRLF